MSLFKEIEPGLLICSDGRVFKEARYSERGTTHIKYKYVSYKGKRADVHRLVAKSFIPNENKHPFVLHADDNQENNNVENLRWGTAKQNMDDARRNGKFDFERVLGKYKADELYRLVFIDLKNNREIAKIFGVSEGRISQVLKSFGIKRS
jgi:ribosomal protein L33